MVAILSQAPGGLELLPTADYNDGKPWLKVRDKNGTEILALPKNGDPYQEIYTSPAWYGMVPEGNLGLMNPVGGSQSKEGSGAPSPDSPREILSETIVRVRKFHKPIQKKYKSPTYAHYGAQGQRNKAKDRGGLLASKNLYTCGEVAWEGEGVSKLTPEQILITKDDGNGELKTDTGIKLTIGDPDCPGDGTVPLYSGEAPGKAGIALSFAHGHGNPGQCNEHFSYDH